MFMLDNVRPKHKCGPGWQTDVLENPSEQLFCYRVVNIATFDVVL